MEFHNFIQPVLAKMQYLRFTSALYYNISGARAAQGAGAAMCAGECSSAPVSAVVRRISAVETAFLISRKLPVQFVLPLRALLLMGLLWGYAVAISLTGAH